MNARIRAALAAAALSATVLAGCGSNEPVDPSGQGQASEATQLERDRYSLTVPAGWVQVGEGEEGQLDSYLAKGDEDTALTSGISFAVFVDAMGSTPDDVLEGSRGEMPDATDADPITVDGVELRGVTTTVEGLTLTQYVGEVDGTTLALNSSWPTEDAEAQSDVRAIQDSITWS